MLGENQLLNAECGIAECGIQGLTLARPAAFPVRPQHYNSAFHTPHSAFRFVGAARVPSHLANVRLLGAHRARRNRHGSRRRQSPTPPLELSPSSPSSPLSTTW